MKRFVIPVLVLAVLGAACGTPSPLTVDRLPRPSRDNAFSVSKRICKTAATDYTLERMARYLGAQSTRPRAIARAYVREGLNRTVGWKRYRDAGLGGCIIGIRQATSASSSPSPGVSPV